MIIDEQEMEQETDLNIYEYVIGDQIEVDILEPAMIGFGICGVMCIISLGLSVIIGIIRRSM